MFFEKNVVLRFREILAENGIEKTVEETMKELEKDGEFLESFSILKEAFDTNEEQLRGLLEELYKNEDLIHDFREFKDFLDDVYGGIFSDDEARTILEMVSIFA